MKTIINIVVIGLLTMTTSNSYSQINKGYWMIGGNGNAGSFSSKSTESSSKGTFLNINPNAGYFILDKLALGISGSLQVRTGFNTGFGIGPFARYYFLEKEKTFNILSEFKYTNYQDNATKSTNNILNFKVGTAFFLNDTAALELALNYSYLDTSYQFQNKELFLGVGFQIHLERNK